MAREYDVMVAGHLCLDIIPRFPDTGAGSFEEIFTPGKLVIMAGVATGTGGPVSNTGIAMRRLGNRVSFSARVGDDDFGKLTVDALKRHGHADGVRVVAGATSSYTVAIAPPGIDRIFLHDPGTNDSYGADDLDPALIADCRHFHFGYPPLMRRMYSQEGQELERIFRAAKQAGATTSCDMALPDPQSESGKAPWARILARVLPHVDIFLPSVEESLYMLEPERFGRIRAEHKGDDLIDHLSARHFSSLAERLLSLGAKMVALKSGHRGWYIRTGGEDGFAAMGAARPGDPANWADRELWCPAYRVERIASATGSGDSSIAGFLTALLRGEPIETALKYAVCLGWQNVQVLDAVSGIRPLQEAARFIARHAPLIDPEITSPEWTWRQAHRLWSGPGDRPRSAGR
jgi:sugar/nucleoside kinase (ribokinase family)